MNDLAVYRHLGAVAAKRNYGTVADLVATVNYAWEEMPSTLLERIATVKCIMMRELITHKGAVIKISHRGFTDTQRLGCLWELVDTIC